MKKDTYVCVCVYTGREDTIESPDINPYIYSQMIFTTGCQLSNGKGQPFQQMVLGRLDTHMQTDEDGPIPYIYTNINLKWIKDPNIKT